MLIKIFITISLLCFSEKHVYQDFKSEKTSNLIVKLDSIEKIITENKLGVDSSFYAHYSLTNASKDTIVFVTNSCPSLNTYSIELNGFQSIFNSNVNCSFNAFTFDTIAPAQSIHISDVLLTNSDIKFNDTEVLTFSIPFVQWDNGEIQVNGSAEASDKITYTGKTKLITKYINNKKKKTTNN